MENAVAVDDGAVWVKADAPSPEQIEIYRKRTPEQRVMAGLSLTTAMRRMKRAAIEATHPDWTEQQVDEAVKKVFLYAGD